MADTAADTTGRALSSRPVYLFAALALVAAVLTAKNLLVDLPDGRWFEAFFDPDPNSIEELLVHFSLLPRICLALMAGFSLGIAGMICQHVLRNPLAEPATLGISQGSFLASAVAAYWFPGISREIAALSGGGMAITLVMLIASPRRLEPTATILSGMMVGLTCSAIGSAIALFHDETSASLFVWAAGSLSQDDWTVVFGLAPKLALLSLALAVLRRPLTLLGQDDSTSRSLGLAPGSMRAIVLALVVAISSLVTSAVGIIGFIGLAAPIFARGIGTRRVAAQALCSGGLGALLLLLADQIVQSLALGAAEIPTGAIAGLSTAPLLIWILPRLKDYSVDANTYSAGRSLRPGRALLLGAACLIAAMIASTLISRDEHRMIIDGFDTVAPYLYWRVPRMIAAMSAGMMLSVAGVLLQRLSGNVMASPETLGISSGAALGLVALVFAVSEYTAAEQLFAALSGTTIVLLLVLVLAIRSGNQPQKVILLGVALSSLTGAIIGIISGTGDYRIYTILRWLVGSTYLTAPATAIAALASALVMTGACFLLTRWLALLPLGSETGRGLGLGLPRARALVLSAAALLTAAGTLIVGPLSFVGLMAPSMARMAGFAKPLDHLAASALIGALIMVVADWLSRIVMFPNQIPSGLLATLIGIPYFLWLIRNPSR